MKEARNMRNAVDSLLDDVLANIFSYLPAQSLCYCKCICRSWWHVISDSYQRKKLSQTVIGFFYGSWWKGNHHFTSITSECPSLSFLPFPLRKVLVSDCCNGLVLCWCAGPDRLHRYIFYNLVTDKWHVLPHSICSVG
jgi:hypothetical protein